MHCMRCGRELALGQVFCKGCQADMAQHPVDPATPVLIPPPPAPVTTSRRSARKARKPEEQLSRLRRRMTTMLLMFIVVLLAGMVLIFSLNQKIHTLEQTIDSISQEVQ